MNYKKRNIGLIILAIIIVLFALTGCADVTQVDNCIPSNEHTYGFFGGVWHGAITVFSFVGSLIWDDVAIYAINNNGGWYNFGFVGGLGFLLNMFRMLIKVIKEL